MLSLDSPKWSELQDAYGSAYRVPDILRRLYSNPCDEAALSDAWSSVCHQNTIYSASIAAAPHLVSLVTNLSLKDRLGPLILVGAIAENLDKPTQTFEADAVFESYRSEAIELLTDSIKYGNLLDYELRHSLSALAALLGDSKLAGVISSIDCGVECPKCGQEINLLESSLVDQNP